MDLKAVIVLLILIISYGVATQNWAQKGDIPSELCFNGITYYQTDSEIENSQDIFYFATEAHGHRLFTSDNLEDTPSELYLESENGKYLVYAISAIDPTLTFQFSGCLSENKLTRGDTDKVDVDVVGNTIEVSMYLYYYCCANLDLDVVIEENIVSVYIINNGDICRCLCDYKLDAKISNLPAGVYYLRICGVIMHEPSPQYSDYGVYWKGNIAIS